MTFNANGSINANSVANVTRINAGKENYVLNANLDLAKRTVKIGQIAVLPGTQGEWMRRDGRKNGGEVWTRVATPRI